MVPADPPPPPPPPPSSIHQNEYEKKWSKSTVVTKPHDSETIIPLTVLFLDPCHCGLSAWDLLIGQCARDLPVTLGGGRGERARAALLTLTEPTPVSEKGRDGVDVQRRAQ